MTSYLFSVPESFNPALHEIVGAVFRDRGTKHIAGHLQRVGEAGANAANLLGAATTVLSAVNVGVSVASFVALRAQLKQTEAAVGHLTAKMDARHRDAMFAGIGASLDVLAMADNLDASEARALILSNYATLAKEARLFSGYLGEARAALKSPTAAQFVELAQLEILATSVEVRVLTALGRHAAAIECATAGRERARTTLSAFVGLTCMRTLNNATSEDDIRQLLRPIERLTESDALSLLIKLKVESGKSFFSAVAGEKVSVDQLEVAAVLKSKADGMVFETRLLAEEPALLGRLLEFAGPEPLAANLNLVVVPEAELLAA